MFNKWFGFWFRLLCGVSTLSLVGMMFYHGNTESVFIWSFFLLFGIAWLVGAYLKFPSSKRK